MTEIAMGHGFYGQGRFAMRFRRLFGHRPSDILKRPPHTRAAQLRFGAAAL